MQSTGTRPKVVVSGGARGVVGHAGTRLLADLADKTGLTRGFVQALGLDRVRRSAHEPGRVAVDLAVLLADGGEAIGVLAVLRQHPGLFGPVASDATAWRVLDSIDTSALARLRAAGTRMHVVAEESVSTREIAEALGKARGLPVVPVARENAAEHFGLMAEFFGLGMAASSARTRELLGWTPTGPTLFDDIAAGAYGSAS
jgi:hypothetical protein